MPTQIVKDYLRDFRDDLKASQEGDEAQVRIRTGQQHVEVLITQLETLLKARNANIKARALAVLRNLRVANRHAAAAMCADGGQIVQKHLTQAVAFAQAALESCAVPGSVQR